MINTTADLGTLYSSLGNYEEAEKLVRLALERKRKAVGDDHPDIAVLLGNLAINLSRLGRTDGAKDLYYESLELQRKQLGEHRLVANSMNNLGLFMMQIGDLDGAEQMLHDAHDMWVKTPWSR